jgi:hypothetical protein
LDQGLLNEEQRKAFGPHLSGYLLLGHEQGCVVRVLLSDNQNLPMQRLGAKPWDTGFSMLEAGCPDVDAAYKRIISQRFGVIAPPLELEMTGPEPLGKVAMKSMNVVGPNGEQVLVTEILRREGGQSMLNERGINGINVPANVVLVMKNRKPFEEFWQALLELEAVNDLALHTGQTPVILGGSEGMAFDMILSGYGRDRLGLEIHFYERLNPDYEFKNYPSDFGHTGLVSACWPCKSIVDVKRTCSALGIELVSELGLPLREGLGYPTAWIRGIEGELVELVELG